MFRKMRRASQSLSEEEILSILKSNTSGTLALLGDNGYPYARPLSYAYSDGKLNFHSAVKGHKIDAVTACPKASFCIIDRDDVFHEGFTTHYSSIIAFGKIRIIEDEQEKRRTAEILSDHYNMPGGERRERVINKNWNAFCMLEMDVEHISGKTALALKQESSGK